ncbi:MAG TPA: hypothetical protein VMT97_14795 [Terriglobales bacterium]|nr:hypothetical protein [Terriglobales bacterium]
MRYAKAILEAAGWRVEEAQNVIRWWPDETCRHCGMKGSGRLCGRCGIPKALAPHSVHHDFFGCWDLLAVGPSEAAAGRRFFQVTTRTNLSHRREKVLAGGPWGPHDAILAYRGGRGRHFEVYWGPLFTELGARWAIVARPAGPPQCPETVIVAEVPSA